MVVNYPGIHSVLYGMVTKVYVPGLFGSVSL